MCVVLFVDDAQAQPAFDKLSNEYHAVSRDLQGYVTTQNTINAKVNRHLQYESPEARDEALRAEIKSLEQDIEANEASAQVWCFD